MCCSELKRSISIGHESFNSKWGYCMHKTLWDVEYMYVVYLTNYQHKYDQSQVFFELSYERYFSMEVNICRHNYEQSILQHNHKNMGVIWSWYTNTMYTVSCNIEYHMHVYSSNHWKCIRKRVIFCEYCNHESMCEIYRLSTISALNQNKIDDATMFAYSAVILGAMDTWLFVNDFWTITNKYK